MLRTRTLRLPLEPTTLRGPMMREVAAIVFFPLLEISPKPLVYLYTSAHNTTQHSWNSSGARCSPNNHVLRITSYLATGLPIGPVANQNRCISKGRVAVRRLSQPDTLIC